MEQTAVKELISEMEKLKETKLFHGSFKAIEDCIYLCYAKLEKEQQKIIDAWENGYEHGACVNEDENKYHGIQYYKEKFE
jgi:predicted transcriptional regulator